MDNVQKPYRSDCYSPPSESFRFQSQAFVSTVPSIQGFKQTEGIHTVGVSTNFQDKHYRE
jgi:hypothetical protein